MSITDDRLKEIIADGHPNDTAWFKEHNAMATELLALRDRNRRVAQEILSGNSYAALREYSRKPFKES